MAFRPARVLLFAMLAAVPRLAQAAPPSPELLNKLAAQGAQMQATAKKLSFVAEGKLESVDKNGKTEDVKEMKARVESDGKLVTFIVERYVDDGEDKTSEAQRNANEQVEKEKAKSAEERKKDENKIRIPFLADQQSHYVFDQVETDVNDPDRVRITFVPREPSKETIEGSIWADARTGRPYSTGFKLSKPGAFIDYVHVQIELGAQTTAGPAVSHVALDGAGGLLFIHKHFRAVADLHDYRVAP